MKHLKTIGLIGQSLIVILFVKHHIQFLQQRDQTNNVFLIYQKKINYFPVTFLKDSYLEKEIDIHQENDDIVYANGSSISLVNLTPIVLLGD